MTSSLKQGSVVCNLGAMAMCIATTSYLTYKLAKHFINQNQRVDYFTDFNNTLNEGVEKALMGFFSATTLILTSDFLLTLDKNLSSSIM